MGILSRFPGISSENSRKRNVAVGVVYAFVFFMVIGAAAPPEDGGTNESSAAATDVPTEKMTSVSTDKATQKATAKSTAKPTEKSTPTPTPEPTPTPTPTPEQETTYTVKISYDGSWRGALGGDGSIRSVSGSGTETFELDGEPSIISANAQKKDSGSGELTVTILENGEEVSSQSTTAEFGVAQTSTTV